MALLLNAQMTVAAAPGTAAFVLQAATPGAQSFAAAGLVDGTYLSYRAEEAGAWEVGVGLYAAAGAQLVRSYVLASSNANAAVSFGAGVVVSQVAAPADLGHGFRNGVRNGLFAVNQKAVSGTVTLAAGAIGHDLWAAGASGASYTFAPGSNGAVTLTGAGSSANTILQILPGKTYVADVSGAYVLSWSGTASARAYARGSTGAPAFSAGVSVRLPNGEVANALAVTGVAVGTDLVVEFNLAGGLNLGRVQFERGLYPTPFDRRDDELSRCQKYLSIGAATLFRANSSGNFGGGVLRLRIPSMAAKPSLQVVNPSGSYTGSVVAVAETESDLLFCFDSSGAPGDYVSFTWYASVAP